MSTPVELSEALKVVEKAIDFSYAMASPNEPSHTAILTGVQDALRGLVEEEE